MSLRGTAGRVGHGPACLESMPPDPTGMRGSTAPSARRLAGGGRFGVAIVLHPAPRGAGRPDMSCSDFREGLGLSSNPVAICVVEQPPTWPRLRCVMVSLGLPRSTGIKCPSVTSYPGARDSSTASPSRCWRGHSQWLLHCEATSLSACHGVQPTRETGNYAPCAETSFDLRELKIKQPMWLAAPLLGSTGPARSCEGSRMRGRLGNGPLPEPAGPHAQIRDVPTLSCNWGVTPGFFQPDSAPLGQLAEPPLAFAPVTQSFHDQEFGIWRRLAPGLEGAAEYRCS